MHFHEDDRAQRLFDAFPILPGQVNISYVNSTEHVVAWHRHEKQTDYWVCIKGSFKVGICNKVTEVVEWKYLSDKNPQTLEIPPGFWHGYMALEPGSIMLYYLDHKYDAEDEFRCRPGMFDEDWKTPWN